MFETKENMRIDLQEDKKGMQPRRRVFKIVLCEEKEHSRRRSRRVSNKGFEKKKKDFECE